MKITYLLALFAAGSLLISCNEDCGCSDCQSEVACATCDVNCSPDKPCEDGCHK